VSDDQAPLRPLRIPLRTFALIVFGEEAFNPPQRNARNYFFSTSSITRSMFAPRILSMSLSE
jgi:hypothetical protein